MDGFRREGQSQREQETRHHRPTQTHGHLTEVDLGFHPRPVRLRHEHLNRTLTSLHPDLRLADRDISTNHLIRHINHRVLGDQPIEDPLHRMPLFPRRIQVSTQDYVDHWLERVQLRRPRGWLLPRRRPRRRQRLDDRAPSNVVLTLRRTLRHPRTGIPADRRVKLYLRHWRHRCSLIPEHHASSHRTQPPAVTCHEHTHRDRNRCGHNQLTNAVNSRRQNQFVDLFSGPLLPALHDLFPPTSTSRKAYPNDDGV